MGWSSLCIVFLDQMTWDEVRSSFLSINIYHRYHICPKFSTASALALGNRGGGGGARAHWEHHFAAHGAPGLASLGAHGAHAGHVAWGRPAPAHAAEAQTLARSAVRRLRRQKLQEMMMKTLWVTYGNRTQYDFWWFSMTLRWSKWPKWDLSILKGETCKMGELASNHGD
jgi:hypothetical protein